MRDEATSSMTPRIITDFVCPPIPNADHWQAHDDNLGEDCSPYGIGQTKAEAIADLMWKLEDMAR